MELTLFQEQKLNEWFFNKSQKPNLGLIAVFDNDFLIKPVNGGNVYLIEREYKHRNIFLVSEVKLALITPDGDVKQQAQWSEEEDFDVDIILAADVKLIPTSYDDFVEYYVGKKFKLGMDELSSRARAALESEREEKVENISEMLANRLLKAKRHAFNRNEFAERVVAMERTQLDSNVVFHETLSGKLALKINGKYLKDVFSESYPVIYMPATMPKEKAKTTLLDEAKQYIRLAETTSLSHFEYRYRKANAKDMGEALSKHFDDPSYKYVERNSQVLESIKSASEGKGLERTR